MPKMKKCDCACDKYGTCGACVMRSFEPKPARKVIRPNKSGECKCLQTPGYGFVYTAHEIHNGEIVTVQHTECENTKLKLVDLRHVKEEKKVTLDIAEKTDVSYLVWINWCCDQCPAHKKQMK